MYAKLVPLIFGLRGGSKLPKGYPIKGGEWYSVSLLVMKLWYEIIL